MSRAQTLPVATLVLTLLGCVAAPPAQGQSGRYIVLYNFAGSLAGAYPSLTAIDAAGNLYGSTEEGGNTQQGCGDVGCGLVFKLSHRNFGWVETVLYDFLGNTDGRLPRFGPTIGPDGNLYGTTGAGGNHNCDEGCGIVYKLQPPATFCRSILCPWTETILYTFTDGDDGAGPSSGVSFDSAGNFYGTTATGGYLSGICQYTGCGVVYKFSASNGGWTESVLYAFQGATDGFDPQYGVVMDSGGDVFGTSYGPAQGGGAGNVYELTPNGSGYTKSFYYVFPVQGQNGSSPTGLLIDSTGNLYGGTLHGGPQMGGTVYELSTNGSGASFSLLYALTGTGGVTGPLTMDAEGNLYGVAFADGLGQVGSVFKLTRSGDSWTYTSLHDFRGGADGAYPGGSVLLDAQGNIYGATDSGGTFGFGLIYEITQ